MKHTTDTTTSWRHVSDFARTPVGRTSRSINAGIHAKPFAEAYEARPTRRGAPPH